MLEHPRRHLYVVTVAECVNDCGDAGQVMTAGRETVVPAVSSRRFSDHLFACVRVLRPVLDHDTQSNEAIAVVVISHERRQRRCGGPPKNMWDSSLAEGVVWWFRT